MIVSLARESFLTLLRNTHSEAKFTTLSPPSSPRPLFASVKKDEQRRAVQ